MAATLTRTKKVCNLTDSEYKACLNLNLRGSGLMQGQLVSCRRYSDKESFVTMRFNREGVLEGWALVFENNYKPSYLDAYFYVRKKCRRKGLGKHLIQHVNRRFGEVRVYPHDSQSNAFFNFVYENNLNIDIRSDYDY